jgi:hypothetical protein
MKIIGAAFAAFLAAVPLGATAKDLAPQSNQGFGVTVRVTPADVAADAKAWVFEVVLDTHSQDLSDDFTRSAALIDANGKPRAPVAWDGAAPGGHHRKGVLRFDALKPIPPVLELRLQRPGEAAPRVFRWVLK